MKRLISIKLVTATVIAACGLMTSGCWPAHPHSAYLTIHQCAINGDAAGVAAELTKFPNELNLPEDDGETALHLAAGNCHTNVVVVLLSRGAKIDIKANDKATPLHLAAQEGCMDVVAILVEHGAKINERDNQTRTPLDRAQQWHQTNIVAFLKQHGAVQ
jgi:hypothetical protein